MKKKVKRGSKIPPVVFLKGKTVYLRPITEADLPWLTVWINDPEVTQFLTASYPKSLADETRWLERLAERSTTDIILAMVTVKDDLLIGTMGLHQINHLDGTTVTGSFIGRKELWGQGYGTEAKMLLLGYAFYTLNLRKVCSAVHSINPRSKRCLEKCGYHEEGRRRAQHYRNGSYCDEIMMAVFKEDFLPRWEKFRQGLSS